MWKRILHHRCRKGRKKVVALDLMNGIGRHGWWRNLEESIKELGLGHKVLALKTDAQTIPLKDCAVDKAVAAHSIRNFQSREAIRAYLREMNRVLSADGER
jgi:ubiquinone/menaquinone biosynthesis C-methylase UbiE